MLGAKIDGPRYKWNGVYNQYLDGGICTPLSRDPRRDAEMRGERGEGRVRRSRRRRGEADTAVGGSPLLVLVSRLLRTRLYLSNRCPRVFAAPFPPFSLSPPECSRGMHRCGCCHLHTRNKSNNKIIMVCGNASYLSLTIVYLCQLARFKIELVALPELMLRYVRRYNQN